MRSCGFFKVQSLVALAAILLVPAAVFAQSPWAKPGEFIVKFKDGVQSSKRASVHARLGVKMVKSSKLTGSQLVRSNKRVSIDHQYAKELLASGMVEYIEPNYIWSINALPNDTNLAELWGMHNDGQTGGTADVDVDGPEAWDLTTGSEEIVVGVVDTGVNYLHPDLRDNMWVNPGEIPGNNIDDDGNGVVDDVHGFSSTGGPAGDPMDDHSHGTHCAGTIGGRGNNALGVAGVAWNVKIMGLKFLDSSGFGSTQQAIDAIEYAVAMKQAGVNLKILSNSWGGGSPSTALEAAIQAANDAGILFVAAAGNAGSDNDFSPTYPANYETGNVLSVAAIDSNGNLASFSNYGPTTVDVAAPGVNIYSTVLGEDYTHLSGTSMATPHVSGVAALIAAREPGLNVAQLKERIMNTTKPLPTLSADQMVAPGVVSAYRALTNQLSPNPPSSPDKVQYSKSAVTYAYDEVLGQKILDVDDGYFVVGLGFQFPYYTEPFSHLAISSNGRVVPVPAGSGPPAQTDYANRLTQGMSVLHDDYYPADGGGVFFKTDATKAVVTWVTKNYAHRNSSDPENLVTFQLKLFANGAIEYHFADTVTNDAGFDHGASATVGVAPVSTVSGEKLEVSHNTANPGEIGSGRALRFEVGSSNARNDYDGDGKSDIIVWRPSNGYFFILKSSTNFDFAEHDIYQLGLPGDIPMVVNIDGDNRADLAVWRPAFGMWFFRSSTTGYQQITAVQWGLPSDVPYPGDFDGDGTTDISIFRPEEGAFYVLMSAAGSNRNAAISGDFSALLVHRQGGTDSDLAGTEDMDNDGRQDFVTVWRPARYWSAKTADGQLLYSLPWGLPTDKPLVCRIGGTPGHTVVRDGGLGVMEWYTVNTQGQVFTSNFGQNGDTPSCDKDFDGDGESDRVSTKDGRWLIQNSSDSSMQEIFFGLPGDIHM